MDAIMYSVFKTYSGFFYVVVSRLENLSKSLTVYSVLPKCIEAVDHKIYGIVIILELSLNYGCCTIIFSVNFH